MTTFEKRSAGTNYDERDSHPGRDSHPQHAGLPTGGNVMSTWAVAFYDYAEQVLKAQRQFAHSMLDAAAPMLDVARGVMSPDANEGKSANNQLEDARSDQGYDGSNRSRKNERYNDDDTAEYNKRSVDNNTSDDYTSDASRTERANTQMDARSDQGHDGSNRSRKNERYNDDDTAEYNKRSVDNNTSDDYTSDASRTERANTQVEESAETQAARRSKRS